MVRNFRELKFDEVVWMEVGQHGFERGDDDGMVGYKKVPDFAALAAKARAKAKGEDAPEGRAGTPRGWPYECPLV